MYEIDTLNFYFKHLDESTTTKDIVLDIFANSEILIMVRSMWIYISQIKEMLHISIKKTIEIETVIFHHLNFLILCKNHNVKYILIQLYKMDWENDTLTRISKNHILSLKWYFLKI